MWPLVAIGCPRSDGEADLKERDNVAMGRGTRNDKTPDFNRGLIVGVAFAKLGFALWPYVGGRYSQGFCDFLNRATLRAAVASEHI